jgi:RHS repeat-associated protein
MVDAAGTSAFGYNTNGLLAFEDGPWADDTVSFDYNTARLRTGLTLLQPNASAWGQTYGYDSIRRLTNTASPAGTFSYDYMPGVGAVTAASTLVKKLSLPGGSYVTNSFDAVARLLSTVLKNSSQANFNSHSYLYNSVSERTKQTRLDGSFVDYTYDGIGQLLAAKGKESGGTSRWNEQFSYGYDKGGNLHYRTNYDLAQTFTVNDASELTGVGRNAAMTVSGTTSEAATSATVNSVAAVLYGDKTFARTNVALADGNNTFTAIGQDALGRKDTNTVTIKLPASISLQYDAKGNLTNDARRSFVYDDEDQLTQVVVTNGANNSTRSDFVYDGLFRRRIRREWSWVNGNWAQSAEVRYVYDGRVVIQERDANDLPAVTYTRGLDLSGSREGAGGIGGLLARTDHGSGQSAFYHADGNGNITALVNGQQLLVARYTYDPFGNTLAMAGPLADANLIRFGSQEHHQPSGLLLYLYRAYDPNLQRFVSREPLGEIMGPNLYRFVLNSPVNGIDLFGLDGEPTLWNLRDDDELGDTESSDEFKAIRCKSEQDLKKFSQAAQAAVNQFPPVQVFTAATGKDAMGNEVGTGEQMLCAVGVLPAAKAVGPLTKLKKLCKFGRGGKYLQDFPTKATKNWRACVKSEGEARALARTKLGKDPVEIQAGKWRSRNGRWQYRAKPGDIAKNHVNLEQLDPGTGEVIQNIHLEWPEGAEQ